MRTGNMGKLLSLDARGKFGYSGAFGRIAFGYTRFGFYSWYAGIYSRKYYFGKPYISRMKFYRPTNPRTVFQQNWRSIQTYGAYLWNTFTSDRQAEYRLSAVPKRMTGYNLWLSQFLSNRPHGFGAIYFGWGM